MIQQAIHHGLDVSIQRDTSNLMYRQGSARAVPPGDEISQWHGAHLAHSEGVLLAGRHPLELDEVVVGAVSRHQRAGVLEVLALGLALLAPVCADGASADGFLFLVSCC